MVQRWYLSNVTGTGTLTDQVRPVAHDLARALGTAGIGCASVLLNTRALCLIEAPAAAHTTISGDARVDILPNIALTALWSTVSAGTRNNVLNRLTARGFSTTGIVTTLTFGQILRLLGRQLEPAFDETRQRAG